LLSVAHENQLAADRERFRKLAFNRILADKRFRQLKPTEQHRVLAGVFETVHSVENMRQEDRYLDRTLRLGNRRSMIAHLRPILKILDNDVGSFDAADWLVGHHRGDVSSAFKELRAFRETAERLLAGAEEFEPWPGRLGRGEPQLKSELQWQACFKLLELLETVGVRVGKTGEYGRTIGEGGGPGSRLLSKLTSYAVGFGVGVGKVKAILLRRRKVG
jgi:hypothetical protein